jgi:hypothetical protein
MSELFSDFDFMKSLKLPSDADTPMIPIAGGIAASLVMAIVYLILHWVLLKILRKNNDNSKIDFDIRIRRKHELWRNISLIFFYLSSIYWIKNYIEVIEIKFYIWNTFFVIAALLTTFIFATWSVNLFRTNK